MGGRQQQERVTGFVVGREGHREQVNTLSGILFASRPPQDLVTSSGPSWASIGSWLFMTSSDTSFSSKIGPLICDAIGLALGGGGGGVVVVVVGCTPFPALGSIEIGRLPKDPSRRKEWLAAIRRDNYTPGKQARLCSKHFRPDDFDRTSLCYGRASLTGGARRCGRRGVVLLGGASCVTGRAARAVGGFWASVLGERTEGSRVRQGEGQRARMRQGEDQRARVGQGEGQRDRVEQCNEQKEARCGSVMARERQGGTGLPQPRPITSPRPAPPQPPWPWQSRGRRGGKEQKTSLRAINDA
ncbi:hypothetical protein O3P69_008462 [Scylla paramamosain]|uniref:THAP-type domain-containing protein n=1 Tax=Scylla paramamosain TaxID=85552 RepID=A0AAW0SKW1_SCYPA